MSNLDPRLQRLADKIRTVITQSSFSPADIARHLDVDRSAVTRWMSGERTPTMKNLMDLADLLGMETSEFWAGPEAIPATPEQKALVAKMAQMTPEQQQALLALAAAASGLIPPKS